MNRILKRKSNVGDDPVPKKAPKHVEVRKCDPPYIKFGFIILGSDAELTAQCVECGKICQMKR